MPDYLKKMKSDNLIAFALVFSILGQVPVLTPVKDVLYIPLMIILSVLAYAGSGFRFKNMLLLPSLIFVWAIIASIATSSFFTLVTWQTIFLFIFMSISCWSLDEKGLKKIFSAASVTLTVLLAISLLVSILSYTPLRDNPHLVFGGYSLKDTRTSYLVGILGNSATVGAFASINMILILVSYLHLDKVKNMKTKLYYILSFFLALYCSYDGHSRASYVALVVVSCFLIFSYIPPKARKIMLIIILVLIVLSIIFFSQIIDFLNSISSKNWSTGSGRIEIWQSAIHMIKLSPVFGYGTRDNFALSATAEGCFKNISTHNSYLHISVLFGLPALALLLIWIISILSRYISAMNREDAYSGFTKRMLLSIFLFHIVENFFEISLIFRCQSGQVFFFLSAICLSYMAKREKKEEK